MPTRDDFPRPLLSAHRGGGEGKYPANSLQAITAAAQLGADSIDLIEFDVRVSLDGQFLIAHDDSVETEAGCTPIGRLTAAEVLAAQPGVANLDDVLHAIAGRCRAHVDLKDSRAEIEIADRCIDALGPDGFVMTSLEDESVGRLRQSRPELEVGLSLGRSVPVTLRGAAIRLSELAPQRRVARCGATFLAVNHQLARLGVLRWAYRHELPVLLWTLNTPQLIRDAQRDSRVWAYTTDYPRLAWTLQDHGSSD